MNKWFFWVLALLVLAGNCVAYTVFERSFEDMGYPDFEVEGTGEEGCKEVMFLFPETIDFSAEENYPVASLHVSIMPIKGKEFAVSIRLNNTRMGDFGYESFYCEEECWLRAQLPKELLKKGENKMDVCLKNSIDVSRSVLEDGSKIGVYRLMDFSAENTFKEVAENETVVLGEKTKIKLLLHNAGGAAGFVEMKHARKLADDKEAYVVVDGNTQFSGFIGAGETIEISYVIKPRVLGDISLPPPILYYQNYFGDRMQKFGKTVTIHVVEPEKTANAFVVKGSEINLVGEIVEMQIALKNEGLRPLFNLGIYIILPEGLDFVEKPAGIVTALKPGETEYIDFSVLAHTPGEYKIGCSIAYLDINASESKCEQSAIVFRERKIPAELWIGLALVLIAVGAYVYIQKTG